MKNYIKLNKISFLFEYFIKIYIRLDKSFSVTGGKRKGLSLFPNLLTHRMEKHVGLFSDGGSLIIYIKKIKTEHEKRTEF